MEENLMFILTRKYSRSNMKKILFSFVCLVFISCGGSDDVDESIAAIDPIIGAWSIEVESTYIVDDESIVSLSDRITQFSTHLLSLRQKTTDELAEENNMFGTHRLTCFKFRHLGDNIHRAIQPVRMPTGDLKRNFINLSFENFNITEVGDLQDMVDSQVDVDLISGNGASDIDI